MKGIAALIKIHAFELDEKRRALKDIEEVRVQIELSLARLAQELSDEQVAARQSTEGGYAYGGFARAVIQRRTALREQLESVTRQVEDARDAVARSFETLKKYEITKENRDSAAAAEAGRRDRIVQDELGLNAYSRGKPASS